LVIKQVYCTLVMEMNLLEKKTGGVWRSEYRQIIEDGLYEARNVEYDDVYLFMEPTGQEAFKTILPTIRSAQEFATIITPFLITPANITNGIVGTIDAQKLIVNGRGRAIATYAGEFEIFDDITYKKYWVCPIGSIGKMLARIMDRKLGAWTPSWANVDGMGGQLDRPVLRAKYGFDDSNIEDKYKVTYILDSKGINPITLSSEDGLMILSSKTTEDPNIK